MNTRMLECFLVAAEEMNFSRAADRLYLSQQSLSYQIQKLEEEYNTPLFERYPSLRLTLAGRDMLFYAKQILNLDAQIRADFADISTFCRGQIRLGIARLRSATVFSTIYKEYRKKWENIDFKLEDGSSQKFAHMLENQELDVYIGFHPLSDVDFYSINVGMDRLVCCMNRTFLEKYKQALFPSANQGEASDGMIGLQDICRFPLCLLPSTSILRSKLDQYLSSHHIKPNIAFESAAQDTALQMCRDNPMIAILTNTAYSYYVGAESSLINDVIAFPIREELTNFQIYLVYRRNRAIPQYLQDFISIASTVFQQHSDFMQEVLNQSGTDFAPCESRS